jgi:hypothetical protein
MGDVVSVGGHYVSPGAEHLILEAILLVSINVDGVGAGASDHRVVTVSCENVIGAVSTTQVVGAATTDDGVPDCSPADLIAAAPTGEFVRATQATDNVVAAQAEDMVFTRGAGEGVGLGGAIARCVGLAGLGNCPSDRRRHSHHERHRDQQQRNASLP